MIWNHDQDEPLMTRRKFFFLAGMAGAFAVAQTTGLVALAERVVIPKRVMHASISVGDILAEIYAPLIREQINRNDELLRLLGGQDAVEIAAREHHVPLARTKNAHR